MDDSQRANLGLASRGLLGESVGSDHGGSDRNKEEVGLIAANGQILADHVPDGSGSTQERSQPVALPICIAPLGQGA